MTQLKAAFGTLVASLVVWFVLGLTPAAAQPSNAAQAHVTFIEPLIYEGQLAMDIDMSLALNTGMREALRRGVPVFFVVELEIVNPRWWWFDKEIVKTTLVRRLWFHTLTQQWQVSTGDVAVSAGSFEQALGLLGRVRNWPIVLSDRFEPDTRYMGRVRIRLDTSQLARPLQMDANSRAEWSLNSAWKTFEFSIRRLDRSQP